jgi:YidC/Oxa1 family membrane protein insertase
MDWIIGFFTNILLFLYSNLGHSFVLAIFLVTVAVRLATLPLTNEQTKQQKKMQLIQPQIKEIQEKYKNDPQKMQQEFTKIGYNPFSMLSGCLPLLLQFPILIAMYQSIERALPTTPLRMVNLYQSAYPGWFPNLSSLIPVKNHFLWMTLSQPERLFLDWLPIGIPVLTIIVVVTTMLQQQMMTPATTSNDPNDQAASMQRSMMFTMPLMLGWFSLNYNAGLSIYFIVSNIATVLQYAFINRENFHWQQLRLGGFNMPFPSFAATPVAMPAKPAAVVNRKSKN